MNAAFSPARNADTLHDQYDINMKLTKPKISHPHNTHNQSTPNIKITNRRTNKHKQSTNIAQCVSSYMYQMLYPTTTNPILQTTITIHRVESYQLNKWQSILSNINHSSQSVRINTNTNSNHRHDISYRATNIYNSNTNQTTTTPYRHNIIIQY